MKIKLSKLNVHPENDRIYDQSDLADLEKSLLRHGQMEPLAVTDANRIISGHRRYSAMRNIGWEECEARLVNPENEVVSLIEHNRYRQKTVSDILNEARILEKQLRENVGRGRYAAAKRTGYKKGERITMVVELSKRLGVGTTTLKQLFSISNYQPDLIKSIDAGEISVTRAYEIIRLKHLGKKSDKSNQEEQDENLRKVLRNSDLELPKIQEIIKETFPYCLELTNIGSEKRTELIEHLDYLNQLDSEELMLVRKKDELDFLKYSEAEMEVCEKMLPSARELDEFWKHSSAIDQVEMRVVGERGFSKAAWNICRVGMHSAEFNKSPGRSLGAVAGFTNALGFRILGLISLNSDSCKLKTRDEHIGWNTVQRERNRECVVNLNVCCPSQPFGYNYLGGKFISLFVRHLIPVWEDKYKTKIVAIVSSSLHDGLGQYDGMNYWKKLGSSSGRMLIKPLRQEWQFWRTWYRQNYRQLYEKSISQTSPVQSSLATIFKILGINVRQYFHNHQRKIYLMPLYSNYKEFLTDLITPAELKSTGEDWYAWWREKSLIRKEKLESNGNLQQERLFYSSITDLELGSWLDVRGV